MWNADDEGRCHTHRVQQVDAPGKGLRGQRQLRSVSRRSLTDSELTVSDPLRSLKCLGGSGAKDRSQGTADIALRQCEAKFFRGGSRNPSRRHPASKGDRMSAAQTVEFTHRAQSGCTSALQSSRLLCRFRTRTAVRTRAPVRSCRPRLARAKPAPLALIGATRARALPLVAPRPCHARRGE